MKEFFNDYWNTAKGNVAFMKRHPIGVTVITLVSGLVGAAIPFIWDKIEERKFEKELMQINNVAMGESKED